MRTITPYNYVLFMLLFCDVFINAKTANADAEVHS